MAVYEGARLRPMALPLRRTSTVIARRRQPVRVRAGLRTSPVAVALAAVLVLFLLGLFYLTQTMRVAATNYDIDTLLSDRDHMGQQLQSLQGDIARLGAEFAVSKLAQQQGLSQLGAPVWIRAR